MFKFATNTLSIPKIWLESFGLYKQTLSKVWYVVLAMQLIVMLLMLPLGLAMLNPQIAGSKLFEIYAYFAIYIMVPAVYIYMVAAIFHRIYYLASDKSYRLKDSLRYVLSKIITVLVAMGLILLVFAVLRLIGFRIHNEMLFAMTTFAKLSYALIWGVIAIVTVLYLLLFFSTLFFILFKDAGILDSMKKSIRLVLGNLWRTFAVVFVPVVVYLLINILVITVFKVTNIYVHSSAIFIVFSIVNILLVSVLLPYIKSVLLVQFNDLLQRKSV